MSAYVFEHSWEGEQHRLGLLEQTFDPGTMASLAKLPLPAGARALEVGGGAGSIARWLCNLVGPKGAVVATDLETGFLEQLTEPNLEVRRHDIVNDPLEEKAFDLIHARLVLEHIPARGLVLARLAAALAPGGWLVLEDFDWPGRHSAPNCGRGDLLQRATAVWGDMLVAAGYRPDWGPALPLELRAAGLAEVGAEGRVHVALAGTPAAGWWQMNLTKFRPQLLAAGFTEAEADEAIGLPERADFCLLYPTLVTAWGRSPG